VVLVTAAMVLRTTALGVSLTVRQLAAVLLAATLEVLPKVPQPAVILAVLARVPLAADLPVLPRVMQAASTMVKCRSKSNPREVHCLTLQFPVDLQVLEASILGVHPQMVLVDQ